MKVAIAVQPAVLTNPQGDAGYPRGLLGRLARAIAWLGDRHLCHQPINKKSARA